MKNILLIYAMCSWNAINCQTWDWVKTYDDVSGMSKEEGDRIVIGNDNKIYCKGNADLYGGVGGQSNMKAMILEYSSGGIVGSVDSLEGNFKIDVDKNGNRYVLAGSNVKKLSSTGQLIWSKTFHKRNFTDLSVTKSGKVVIGGSTMNAFCTDTSAYYMLDVDGTELWQRIGDYAQCGTLPFTNDNNENTYTLGYIKVNTAYIPKVNIVNGAGNVINQITTLPNPKLINISDDLSVYVVSTIQGPSSNCTVIATKYDQSANIVWSKSLTGKGFDITCIRSDSTGLYIAGSIYQFMSFDNINFTSKGLIIIKTDNCGNMVWSKRTNGNYGNITINDFAVAPDQSLLLTGMIQSTHSFDSFSVTGDPDYYDMYLAKLIQPGVPADVKKKDNVYPDFNLYPLPTSGFFVVNYSREKTSGSIRVRIFNALGQIVYSGNETFQKSYTRDFDLSCQSKGVYFVELSAENLRLIKRVIIE